MGEFSEWYFNEEKDKKISIENIKEWFLNKIELPYGYSIFPLEDFTIVGETEKAYKLSFIILRADDVERKWSAWVPKSVILSDEEVKKMKQERKNAFEKGKQEYEKMLSFAKKHNIKGVRNRMTKKSILKKIEDAGFKYP